MCLLQSQSPKPAALQSSLSSLFSPLHHVSPVAFAPPPPPPKPITTALAPFSSVMTRSQARLHAQSPTLGANRSHRSNKPRTSHARANRRLDLTIMAKMGSVHKPAKRMDMADWAVSDAVRAVGDHRQHFAGPVAGRSTRFAPSARTARPCHNSRDGHTAAAERRRRTEHVAQAARCLLQVSSGERRF